MPHAEPFSLEPDSSIRPTRFCAASHLPVDVRQRRPIQDARRRVSNFLHRQPHTARRLVDTLDAPRVCRVTHARYQCQRTLQRANRFAESDLVGRPPQVVPATLPFATVDKSVPLQIEENRLEKLPGKRVALGQLRDQHGPFPSFLRQQKQRLQTVLGLSRQQTQLVYSTYRLCCLDTFPLAQVYRRY